MFMGLPIAEFTATFALKLSDAIQTCLLMLTSASSDRKNNLGTDHRFWFQGRRQLFQH